MGRKTKGELANPGSPGKWPLKRWWRLIVIIVIPLSQHFTIMKGE